ncbi:hypothetical protein RUND412_003138 [Rhizina undulata]
MARSFTIILYVSLFVCLVAGRYVRVDDDMELDKRQDNSTAQVTTATVNTPTTVITTNTPDQTTPTPTTSTPQNNNNTPTTTAGNNATPTTDNSSPTTSETTPTVNQGTTTPAPTTTEAAQTTLAPVTSKRVTTIILTISGSVTQSVSTSTSIETPTAAVTSSGIPGTAGSSDSSSSSSGLSTGQRNTIIGVVVGVGGAILFGGLGIVAWRLKKRKTNPVDEDDLMRRDGSPLAAGRETSSPEVSPFKSTLDQYHKPPGTVNASSNF